MCKILESLIRDNTKSYLEEYNLVSTQQHGFRTGFFMFDTTSRNYGGFYRLL